MNDNVAKQIKETGDSLKTRLTFIGIFIYILAMSSCGTDHSPHVENDIDIEMPDIPYNNTTINCGNETISNCFSSVSQGLLDAGLISSLDLKTEANKINWIFAP